MAQLTYTTFEDWGKDSFCVTDYFGWLEDNYPNQVIDVDTLPDCMNLAGLVLFDDDTNTTLFSFLDMAADSFADIILVEFANLNNENRAKFEGMVKNYFENITHQYVDLESYENRAAYGYKQKWNKE